MNTLQCWAWWRARGVRHQGSYEQELEQVQLE